MNDSWKVHVMNAAFILFFFIAPIVICWHYPEYTIPYMLISFAIGVFLLADLYHMPLAKSLRGYVKATVYLSAAAAVLILILYLAGFDYSDIKGKSIFELKGTAILLMFIAYWAFLSLLMGAVALINIPRLLLMKALKIE